MVLAQVTFTRYAPRGGAKMVYKSSSHIEKEPHYLQGVLLPSSIPAYPTGHRHATFSVKACYPSGWHTLLLLRYMAGAQDSGRFHPVEPPTFIVGRPSHLLMAPALLNPGRGSPKHRIRSARERVDLNHGAAPITPQWVRTRIANPAPGILHHESRTTPPPPCLIFFTTVCCVCMLCEKI